MAKESAFSAGEAEDVGSIPGLKRSPFQEEEMATHSSILPWEVPRTGELGGLQSTGSQRVRHNCSDRAPTAHTQLGSEHLRSHEFELFLNQKPPRDVTMVILLSGNKHERGFVSYLVLEKTSFSLI